LVQEKRFKKRYTFFSLLIICSMIMVSNLLFSSFSKTDTKIDIARQNSKVKSEAAFLNLTAPLARSEQKNEPEFIIRQGTISNRPLYCELREHQISPAEILKLSEDFKAVFDFKKARKKDEYTLFLSKENKLEKMLYSRNVLTQYIAIKNKSGRYDVAKQEIVLTKKVVVKEFILKESLFQTILSSGEGHTLAFEFAEIFSWDIDFFLFPKKGDRIQIEFEKFSKDNQFVKYGKILAARYITDKKIFSAFLFKDGKHDNYYDQNGRPLRKMFLRVPIKLGRITSSFSLHRFHPVLKKYRRHTGIDYGAKTGTPIFATANGKVRFSGWSKGYGKLVIVVHPNGYETYYGHCSKLLVNPGKFISQGEVIAKVGSTGQTTGPHVHYEVRINRKPVNPNTIKSTPGKPLAGKFLSEYKTLVSKRLDLFESVIKLASSNNEAEKKT